MKQISMVARLTLVAWMGASVFLFFLVTLSPDGPIAAAMPEFVMQLRTAAFNFFHSKSSLS